MWTQHIGKPTKGDSILDLVITSTPEMIDEAEVLAHLGTSNHNMLRWDLNYLVETTEESIKKDFNRADSDKMKQSLKYINWNTKLQESNTEEAWKLTENTVHSDQTACTSQETKEGTGHVALQKGIKSCPTQTKNVEKVPEEEKS